MHADLGARAFAGDAGTAVAQGAGVEFALLEYNFQQPGGRAARGILFEAVVHLDNLGVVVGAEHPGCALGQREEQVHADGKVSRPDARHLGGEGPQAFFLVGAMAGGADDDGLLVRKRDLNHLGRGLG